MSHFTVLVIGEKPEVSLAPYHKFECTGVDDQYVQDIDITEEARTDYESQTATRLRDGSGAIHNPFDERGEWRTEFSREDGEGFMRRRKLFVPAGYEEVEVPRKDVETFAKFVSDNYGYTPIALSSGNVLTAVSTILKEEHKYGYALADENGTITKVVRRSNPAKKWDWYMLGGRWNGFFRLKAGAASGTISEPSWTAQYGGACADTGQADQARKRDIDFEAMRNEAGEKARTQWEAAHRITGSQVWESWKSVRERIVKIDEARTFYHYQPAIKAFRESKDDRFTHPFAELDEFLLPSSVFVQQARDGAVSTWAIVHDGQWIEKTAMGWWGMSAEVDQTEWDRKHTELIDSLPDDTLLSVYDCHI